MKRPIWFLAGLIITLGLLIEIPIRFETGHNLRGVYDIILAIGMSYFVVYAAWREKR
jgi:hypothetical protein